MHTACIVYERSAMDERLLASEAVHPAPSRVLRSWTEV